jgi:hypothetical protein
MYFGETSALIKKMGCVCRECHGNIATFLQGNVLLLTVHAKNGGV